MTEVDVERVYKITPYNLTFRVLAVKDNIYYVSNESLHVIYKGNPDIGWTEIAKNYNGGYITYCEVNDDGSIYFMSKEYHATKLWIYKAKNGELTLIDEVDYISDNWGNAFKLNDEVYMIGLGKKRYKRTSDKATTEITSNIENYNLYLHHIEDYKRTSMADDKVFGIYTNNGSNYTITSFDGNKLTVLKDVRDSNVSIGRSLITNTPSNDVALLLEFKSTDYYDKRYTFKLFNKNGEVVDTVKTKRNLLADTFVEKKDNKYVYYHKVDGEEQIVEFPVKAYIRRE